MNLIGINGFKRAGKGEAANCLTDLYEGTVKQVGFADKLKAVAANALGFEGTVPDLVEIMDAFKDDGYLWAENDHDERYFAKELTGRQYLQNFGNQARIQFGDTFWIDQVLPTPVDHCPGMDILDHSVQNARHLRRRFPGVDAVAITDLRYPNEAERVRNLGGVIWRVNRPGLTSDGHASEIPLDDDLVDYEILNDGDLETLKQRVATAMLATLDLAGATA